MFIYYKIKLKLLASRILCDILALSSSSRAKDQQQPVGRKGRRCSTRGGNSPQSTSGLAKAFKAQGFVCPFYFGLKVP